MKIFITGATGFIGKTLALKLADDGHAVNALYRSEEKAGGLTHQNIKLFKGSLNDPGSLYPAMENCEQVFHVAAYARAWAKDPQTFYLQNALGTRNILSLAEELGIKKLVHTSTAGVLKPASSQPANEDSSAPTTYYTHYDRSKFEAEQIVRDFVSKGLSVVIVNPTRVYGPGAWGTQNGTALLIDKYIRGKWHIKPGSGKSIGNYVYIDDVIQGMLKAMKKGRPGERYIISGENASFNDLLQIVNKLSNKKHWMVNVPVPVMLGLAVIMEIFAKISGTEPLIVPDFVIKYNQNWKVSNEKARTELGYDPISLEKGIRQTLEWIYETRYNGS